MKRYRTVILTSMLICIGGAICATVLATTCPNQSKHLVVAAGIYNDLGVISCSEAKLTLTVNGVGAELPLSAAQCARGQDKRLYDRFDCSGTTASKKCTDDTDSNGLDHWTGGCPGTLIPPAFQTNEEKDAWLASFISGNCQWHQGTRTFEKSSSDRGC